MSKLLDKKKEKNLPPRNRLVIQYHLGYLKSFPERGLTMRKPSKHLKGVTHITGGKSGGYWQHTFNYGMFEGRRCTSLEAAKAVPLFDHAVRKATFYDENRIAHDLKIKPAQHFEGDPKKLNWKGYLKLNK